MNTAIQRAAIVFRHPTVTDAGRIWRLVRDSGRLDPNSSYCYLLLCRYYSGTCLVAEREGELVGFVTSFLSPQDPANVFVWQIAVSPTAQGQGIATSLLQRLMELPVYRHAKRVEATVSPTNISSRRLFEAFARRRGARLAISNDGFPAALFPEPGHEDEPLIQISF
ncbi:diaminobutyrate acetyltransferase [Paenibacillus chartarius]|uniref:L-2,4-diaminobutyric acid acetyltransferase n=1 Tax=Paenibacillus chartarius TaxID=747481 RepID=A0ABV6DRX3_9BACL